MATGSPRNKANTAHTRRADFGATGGASTVMMIVSCLAQKSGILRFAERTPSAKAKSEEGLKSLITATTKLWRPHQLTYDQARYVAKEVRRTLSLGRPKQRKRVVA
jgi:hypothetical protein